jgi:hypothetical protein
MSILSSLFVDKKNEDEIEFLKSLLQEMTTEINKSTELSNKSQPYNNESLYSAYKWIEKYITDTNRESYDDDQINYFKHFNSILGYLEIVYKDGIDDEVFLNSIKTSFKLLKSLNNIIGNQFGKNEYNSEILNALIKSIDIKLSTLKDDRKINLRIERLKKEIDNITNDSISTFNNRASELYSDLSQSINEKIDGQINSRQKEIDKEVIGFAELRLQLSEQVELFSSTTMADQNQQQAKEETKTADKLRIIGGLWLLIVSTISFYFFYELLQSSKSYDISMLIFRWMSVLFMTIPGIYILRESSIHRADARKYRRLAIQLATINSYLATFEKDDAREVKRSLISNFFSSDETKTDFSSVPDLLKSFEKVQDTILSIASKKSTQPIEPDKEETTVNKKKEEPSPS